MVSGQTRSDRSRDHLTRRTPYDRETRDELNSLFTDLETRGLTTVNSKHKTKGNPNTQASTGAGTKNSAGAQLEQPKSMGSKNLPKSDANKRINPRSTRTGTKLPSRSTVTSGTDAKMKAQAKPGQERISKPGLAAPKRIEDANKASANSPLPTESSKPPEHKIDHNILKQNADQRKLSNLRTQFLAGHEAQMKLDAQKSSGAFGRFKEYATRVHNPSVIPKEEKKLVIKNGVIMDPGKPKQNIGHSQLKGGGQTPNGKTAATWYGKAANVAIHPLHFIHDRRTVAADKKLKFEKQFETQPKVDFQTKQNAFHAAEAERRKDHRLKQ